MVELGNGVYGENQLDALAVEMKERLNELMGLANSKNANGDYIFSGSKVKSQAFTRDAAGNYVFNGDQDQRMLRVSSGVVVPVSDSGFEVFMNIKDGNGKLSKSEIKDLLHEAEISGFIRGLVSTKLIEGYDKDGDKRISWEEFKLAFDEISTD